MSSNLDHLVRGEREAEVVQRHVGQFLEDVPGIGALQAEHPHLLAPIFQGDVEPGILNRGLYVGKVLVGGTASSSNVEATAFKYTYYRPSDLHKIHFLTKVHVFKTNKGRHSASIVKNGRRTITCWPILSWGGWGSLPVTQSTGRLRARGWWPPYTSY